MKDRTPLRLDLRGYRCPVPVIRLEAAMRRFPQTIVFEIETDDPIAVLDIPHFCREAGHLAERTNDDPQFCVFQVTRGIKSTDSGDMAL